MSVILWRLWVTVSVLTTEVLWSPFDMNTMRVTSFGVSSNSSTHTFTITTSITSTGVVITSFEVRFRIHSLVARFEHLMVDDAALDLRPWCSWFVFNTWMGMVWRCWSTRCSDFPGVSKWYWIGCHVLGRCEEIVGLVVVEVSTQSTCAS